jgi:pilus assembly protein CpaB
VGNRRTLIAAAAIVLAAVAGLLVYFYVSNADQRAEDKVQLVQAFVATTDIPKGTSGDQAVASGMVDIEKVLRGSIPDSAVTDSSLLKGKVAAATISARQFITDSSFVAPAEGGGGSLAAAIGDRNKVAVTISVDAERGVADQIAPGDRVDILIVSGGSADYIMRDVKVLAVGSETAASASGAAGQPSSTAAQSGLITFEVSSDDAARVVAANQSGTLYLTLKPIAAGGGGESSVAASGG